MEPVDFNDEIVSIEEIGCLPTVDISVDGEHVFYCNDILTHNSFGLPATADFMFALISDETLQAQNQFLVKILKNRYADATQNRKFLVGVDRSRMKLYDVNEDEQAQLSEANHTPAADSTPPFALEEGDRTPAKTANFGFRRRSVGEKKNFKF